MTDGPFLTQALLARLTQPGPRLPWLEHWLLDEVWSRARFEAAEDVVRDYLLPGERAVQEMEEILAAAAMRAYDELLAPPTPDRDLRAFLEAGRPSAAVVFDGLSLRELPALLRLADRSGFTVQELGVSTAAVPSETTDFTQQRLRLASRVAPTSLPGRGELRAVGIECAYYDSPRGRRALDATAPALLLWSAFPDQTYRDAEANFDSHFAQIQTYLDTAWQNTVQQIPRGRPILVTSDHGYVFFGHGLSAPRSNAALRPLAARFGGERFARLDGSEPPPGHPDVAVIPSHVVAMLRGRVQVHTSGPDANKLYKHGGLSLMEMLTPWLVLTR